MIDGEIVSRCLSWRESGERGILAVDDVEMFTKLHLMVQRSQYHPDNSFTGDIAVEHVWMQVDVTNRCRKR